MATRGITIQSILHELRCRNGPSSKGEYKCHCPAHDDKTESLSISEGERGIVMHCHAGCEVGSICRALGMEVRDLFFVDQKPMGNQASRGKSAPDKKTGLKSAAKSAAKNNQQPKLYMSYAEAYGWLGQIVCVYPYTNEQGSTVFEVARINTSTGKTFRQHRPAAPEKGLFPIVCSVPAEIRGGLIYRLPEVVAAIRAGHPVYVVEGEKDADTLKAMGYCGTTCPGGAENWKPSHSENLKGADVIIVSDNDAAGADYEKAVAAATLGLAKSVRVVHLVDGFPELPEKGDISDLVQLIGAERARDMLDDLVQKASFCEPDLYERAVEAFNKLSGYCIDKGCICQRLEDSTRVLGTFVALPTREITRDDGVSVRKMLEICGWDPGGHRMKTLMVDVAKYKNMDWVMEQWGLVANIMPGSTIRDKLRSAIAAAGAQVAEHSVIYEHTGWRKIDGKWCYLYQGGCIGAEDVSVDMGPGLESYTLDVPEIGAVDAATTSFSLTTVIDQRVSVPLLGVTYLAPLREFLNQGGNPPAFVTMLKGGTGTRKSTAAALFLSHYGNFTNTCLPASFNDTSNYVRNKAFYVKDAPIVVDDYYPTTSKDERRQMQRTAQLLSRAFGNQQERGRLGADLSAQRSRPPRSLAVITGEMVPDIGASGVGRFYVIELEKDYVRPTDELTDLQMRARAGELRAAMRGYIEWLLPQTNLLTDQLTTVFFEYRKRANKLMEGTRAHTRTPEAVAHIMLGLTMMLAYYESLGLFDANSKHELLEEYWGVVAGNSRVQAENSVDDSPVWMFMSALTELLANKTLNVMNIAPAGVTPQVPERGMAGYVDQQNYYLMADTVFGAVVRFFDAQNRLFPISRTELFRQLRAAGIVQQVGSDGKTTRNKRTPDGKNQRLLWIPRKRIDGEREEATQMSLNNFTEVADVELPDGFKK